MWKNYFYINVNPIWKFAIGTILLLAFCEYFIYVLIARTCTWPDVDLKKDKTESNAPLISPVRIMVIADTHLLGNYRGHWFDKIRREWQMSQAFQASVNFLKPDLVFVLGDLTDEGLLCTDEEFEEYAKTFHTLFEVPKETKMYVAVGNHDIGFHHEVRPFKIRRFVKAFNTTGLQAVSLRGVHFVIVNSMALEGDGCYLCRPYEELLRQLQRELKCLKEKKTCGHQFKGHPYSRPILMQHYPLFRQSDIECQDVDAAPDSIKKELFHPGRECLTREATYQLLNQIEPRLVLSGHTHHGCTRKLPSRDGVEITIPSFSWRNKDNPTLGLGVITPTDYAFVKCAIPKESTVITIYIVGLLFIIVYIAFSIHYNRYKKLEMTKF